MTATNQNMQPTAMEKTNGIQVETLMETVNAIQEDSELGACKFRASNTWVVGNHNRSTIEGFYAAKQEIAHKHTFKLSADEPTILAGEDYAANPVEYLLHALASCLTTSMIAHAAVRGIEIQAVESQLEGDLDLNGFLGLNSDTPKGFTEIRVRFRVSARDEDMDTIRDLLNYSPVFNTLTEGTNVDVDVMAV